ncbi:MAG: hypothetical protein JSW59_08175, partial [Phycisphaerales bacterium]
QKQPVPPGLPKTYPNLASIASKSRENTSLNLDSEYFCVAHADFHFLLSVPLWLKCVFYKRKARIVWS